MEAFTGSLFFVAFAYSGWNAAAYAAGDFADPRRDVPRAMLLGCLVVMAIYLVVNLIFVANLSPDDGKVVFGYSSFSSGDVAIEQVTLGQAVMARLMGVGAARVMSAVMVVLFISAMSAMTFIGPRVVSAMARDRFLPKLFDAQNRPPIGGLVLQSSVAVVVVFTHGLRELLENVGAVLVFFAALTSASLFVAARKRLTRLSPSSLICAGVYTLSAIWMLSVKLETSVVALLCRLGLTLTSCAKLGPRDTPSLIIWLSVIVGLALSAYGATRAWQKRSS